jgi:hypothetical protein
MTPFPKYPNMRNINKIKFEPNEPNLNRSKRRPVEGSTPATCEVYF